MVRAALSLVLLMCVVLPAAAEPTVELPPEKVQAILRAGAERMSRDLDEYAPIFSLRCQDEFSARVMKKRVEKALLKVDSKNCLWTVQTTANREIFVVYDQKHWFAVGSYAKDGRLVDRFIEWLEPGSSLPDFEKLAASHP